MKQIFKKMELQPLRVPNYVIAASSGTGLRQDGFKEAPKFHVSELDEETLIALADQFKEELLRKAKMEKP